MKKQVLFPSFKDIEIIIFDFDGIFTDNKVYINQNGEETVRCDKSDSLGFDLLRKFQKRYNWDVKIIVLTKEVNKVVEARCKKLNLTCYQGIEDKMSFLLNNFSSNLKNTKKKYLSKLVYLGNDLNDLKAIEISEYSFAPIDAHEIIKNSVTYVLPYKGGDSFIRNFIEILINLKSLPKDELIKII